MRQVAVFCGLLALAVLAAGCSVSWRPPEEFSSEPEKSISQIWEENEQMIEEMAPKKEELYNYYLEAIPEEYQDETWFSISPMVTQRDHFSVTIQIDIHEIDTKVARELAKELYDSFDPPHTVDSYLFTMVSGENGGTVVANAYRNTDEDYFNIEMSGVWEQYS